MALDLENLVNYSNNIYPFEDDQQYQDELLLPLEAELLCFDSVSPTLFDVDDLLVTNPSPLPLDHVPNYDHYNHCNDIITPKIDDESYSTVTYPCLDFTPPLLLPCEEDYYNYYYYYYYYYNQFLPFPKKQKLLPPNCFDGFVPDFQPQLVEFGGGVKQNNNNNNGCDHHVVVSNGDCKAKVVSAQSKAARERRRKITEKTQELGKLVPGGTKMNTAEMLQAAFKYVKFLQAQLIILQSLKNLQEESDKKFSSNNLSILASQVVQEKLYTKEKCLIPLDSIPVIEEHYDFETNPFILE